MASQKDYAHQGDNEFSSLDKGLSSCLLRHEGIAGKRIQELGKKEPAIEELALKQDNGYH